MEFRVVSANIRFANPADGEHDWVNRKDFMASLVNDFKTDLLGTQEGRQPQLEEMAELLPNMQLIQGHRDWIEERMYPCIFVNPETIYVKNSGDIWLSETPNLAGSFSFDSAFPRLCTWIQGAFKKSGKDFFFVNVHLDHILGTTREQQIRVLIDETKKINIENRPMILAGDFNESPEDGVRKIINAEQENLNDPWQSLKKDEDISFHKFQGELEGASRIDWILVDNRITVKSIDLNKSHNEGVYPSDHFPVMGQFEI
jgi:endonuclease/exonuclease/phosphatase family metal-dependent hydrolase